MKLLLLLMTLVAGAAHADAVDSLREFTRDAKTGRATFTQVVTSADNAKKKTSSGSFDFARPVYPWPVSTRYSGQGDPASPSSWVPDKGR